MSNTQPSAGGGESHPSETGSPSSNSASSGPSYHPPSQATNGGGSPPGNDVPPGGGGVTPPTPPVAPQPPQPDVPVCPCLSSQDAWAAARGATSSLEPRKWKGDSNFTGVTALDSERSWAPYPYNSKRVLNAGVPADRELIRKIGICVHELDEKVADKLALAFVGPGSKPWETTSSRLTKDDVGVDLLRGGFSRTVKYVEETPAKTFVALHPMEDTLAKTHAGAMPPHADTMNLKLCLQRMVFKLLDRGVEISDGESPDGQGAADLRPVQGDVQMIRVLARETLFTIEFPEVMVPPAPHFKIQVAR